MRCPYCGGAMEKKLEFLPLSAKRRDIVDAIIAAGPAGADLDAITKKFFPHNKNQIVIRTTFHYINKKIRPLEIKIKAGKVRIQ